MSIKRQLYLLRMLQYEHEMFHKSLRSPEINQAMTKAIKVCQESTLQIIRRLSPGQEVTRQVLQDLEENRLISIMNLMNTLWELKEEYLDEVIEVVDEYFEKKDQEFEEQPTISS